MIDFSSPYFIVTALSVVIILSYFFNIISEKTNVPSVLMLIALGLGIRQLLDQTDAIDTDDLMPLLEVLGIVGLIMIVLEAALDLKLTREKRGLVLRSMAIALLGFILTSLAITFILRYFTDSSLKQALFYAMPMGIISSAIVIPSIGSLDEERKEFLIYESTFSDIFGIMGFYLAIEFLKADSGKDLVLSFSWNVLATIAISMLLSYILVWLFQRIQSQGKLFLLIAVLIVLYAVGKTFHLSSLLIILCFGLILNNTKLFFRGKMAAWVKPRSVRRILNEFHLITIESAFVIRTFFFVVFGVTITITSLFNIRVFLESVVILAAIYLIRAILLFVLWKRNIKTELGVAPRGLITILLFFAIPSEYQIHEFESGTLLYIILTSSLLMTMSLISNRKSDIYDELLEEDIDQVKGYKKEVPIKTEPKSDEQNDSDSPSSPIRTSEDPKE